MRLWPSDNTIASVTREHRLESDTCEALNVASVGFIEISITEIMTGVGLGSVGEAMTMMMRCARTAKASNSIVTRLLV